MLNSFHCLCYILYNFTYSLQSKVQLDLTERKVQKLEDDLWGKDELLRVSNEENVRLHSEKETIATVITSYL